jgi:hypothetical protein
MGEPGRTRGRTATIAVISAVCWSVYKEDQQGFWWPYFLRQKKEDARKLKFKLVSRLLCLCMEGQLVEVLGVLSLSAERYDWAN